MKPSTLNKPAYSLIFAFLIMTVIMIVAGTTIENTQEKVRYFNELEATSQARLSAESAAELAVMQIREYEPGYEVPEGEDQFCMEYEGQQGNNCQSYGDYTVHPVATSNTNEQTDRYFVPIPGTGTAGLSNECSILNEHEAVEHPCNWNKMMYGDSVTIPLYAIGQNGTTIVNPENAGITDWVLKVRTPCIDEYEEEDTCQRYAFDATAPNIATDPSILFWQVNGEHNSGTTISIIPSDDTFYAQGAHNRITGNTEIPASTINNAQGDYYEVFTMFDEDELEALMEYDSDPITDLNLQLNIINPLIANGDHDGDGENDSIPYLEWQVAMSASSPLISTKSTVVGEGYFEGSNGTYYYPYVITRSSTGENTSIYTLSN